MLANLLFKCITQAIFLFMLTFCAINSASAQDLEPRRWSQMPSGLNFAGIGYGYIDGDIFFDPVLLIEDASFDMHAVSIGYVRSFGLFGKSARVDFTLPYRAGRWQGTVDIDRRQGVKMTLLSGRSQKLTGADIDSVVFAYSLQF